MPATYVADSPTERARCLAWRAPKIPTVIGIRGYTQGVSEVRTPATNRTAKVAADTPPASPSLDETSALTPCVKSIGRNGSARPTRRASASREGQFLIAPILTATALTPRGRGYNRPV